MNTYFSRDLQLAMIVKVLDRTNHQRNANVCYKHWGQCCGSRGLTALCNACILHQNAGLNGTIPLLIQLPASVPGRQPKLVQLFGLLPHNHMRSQQTGFFFLFLNLIHIHTVTFKQIKINLLKNRYNNKISFHFYQNSHYLNVER